MRSSKKRGETIIADIEQYTISQKRRKDILEDAALKGIILDKEVISFRHAEEHKERQNSSNRLPARNRENRISVQKFTVKIRLNEGILR